MYGVIRFVLYKMIGRGISCVVSATATDDTTGCILFAGAARQTDVNKFIKKGSWGHWPIWHLPDFTDLSQVRVQPEIISRTDCLRWRQLQSSCDELLFSVTAPSTQDPPQPGISTGTAFISSTGQSYNYLIFLLLSIWLGDGVCGGGGGWMTQYF